MSTKVARGLRPPAQNGNGSKPSIAGSFDTSVDLQGNPNPERLIVGEHRLTVVGGSDLGEKRREWKLSRIKGFRLEPAIGSSFFQVEVDAGWVDVLRVHGTADRHLTDLVDQLSARRLSSGRGGSSDASSPEGTTSPGFSPTDLSETPRLPRWHTARRLMTMMRPFRGSVALLLALSFGAVAVEVAPPMLQRALVDRVLQADHPSGGAAELLLLLLAIVAGLLLVRLAATLVTIWKGRVSSRVGTTLTANLRNELVRKLNQLPLAFHDRNQVGVLMSRVAYDTETLHTLVYHITGGLLLQSMQLVGIGVMLFYLNPKLAVVTMLPMPLIIAGSWYFTQYLNPRHHHYWEAVGRQASALTGMLSGIRVVKAFVQEDREVDRFCQSSHRLRDSRQTVDYSTSAFAALMGFLFALGGLAVWYIGGRDVLFGQMSLGSLMAFLAYLAMFYTPLTTIAESTTWFSNFFTTTRRIFDVLDTPSEVEDAAPAATPRRCRARVEFQGVTFGYDPNRPVLRDVTFSIEPGEMIGVVGRSGSGKSTLVSLIGRLYEINSGRILVDGVDVRQLSNRQLRRSIGMVPQEPFLFRGSVADNISYGNADAEPEEVLRAAHNADSHGFIMRMPLAYDNRLGEGGTGLSGGERQRLSIARALLFDPAILILDEATASVDAESERAICEALRRFSRRRTTIAIAHRLSTLKDADRLLVFDQGRLIEQGSHHELIAQDGLYSSLVRLQGNLLENRRRMESVLGPQGSNGEFDSGGSLFETYCLDNAVGCVAADDPPAGDDDDDDGGGELHWLDPESTRIETERTGWLKVTTRGATFRGVFAVRAFPANHERKFLSLRDREPSGRENEVGMIRLLDDWPEAVQEAVRRSLDRRYLLHRVQEIRQVRTNGNQLVLSVVAEGNPARVCLEKPGEGCQPFGRHGLLLIDRQGKYFVIPDRGALPRRQQRLLTLYLGD